MKTNQKKPEENKAEGKRAAGRELSPEGAFW
jgi:hypothetical protein